MQRSIINQANFNKLCINSGEIILLPFPLSKSTHITNKIVLSILQDFPKKSDKVLRSRRLNISINNKSFCCEMFNYLVKPRLSCRKVPKIFYIFAKFRQVLKSRLSLGTKVAMDVFCISFVTLTVALLLS